LRGGRSDLAPEHRQAPGIHPGRERFVEEPEFGVNGHQSRERGLVDLPAREGVDGLLGQLQQIKLLEPVDQTLGRTRAVRGVDLQEHPQIRQHGDAIEHRREIR
jgi:hypothetical protein